MFGGFLRTTKKHHFWLPHLSGATLVALGAT